MGDYGDEERAEAAGAVMLYYFNKDVELHQGGLHGYNLQHVLTELLCDLTHYATKEGIPMGACLGAARTKWKDEVKPQRQGKSHELDPTEWRAVPLDGRVYLPCIHGKMHNEACIECYKSLQAVAAASPLWWKRLFGR